MEKHGSTTFYGLLDEMSETHDKKSHDYADNSDPYGNYHFAGLVSSMFAHSPDDAGFAGRLAEKIYRLAVLGRGNKTPKNESVADSERDIATITVLWMADRRDRAAKLTPRPIDIYNADSASNRDAFVQSAGKLHPNDMQFIYEYLGQLMAIRQGCKSEFPSQDPPGDQ